MTSADDHDLLGAFVNERSDEAFRELVDRYLGFVLGTALRQTRNQPVAEEVAQNVLAILARKAGAIRPEALSSWLHRTTLQQSLAAMRSESRHRRKVAAFGAEPPKDPATSGARCFDEEVLRSQSLARLREADKRILLLRFFEGQTLPEIAKRLGQSEAAVQRRGHRALERLGLLLRRRGVVLSTAGLASAFSVLPAETSPILAARVTTQALATAPQLSSAILLTHAFHTMTIAKKLAIGVAVVGTLVAAPVAIKFGTRTPPAPEVTAKHDSPASRPPSPPSGPANSPAKDQSPTTAMRLGRGKQRYSLEEATQISQRIVERLEINGSQAISEWVYRLSEFLQEGFLDPDDWDEIEKYAKAKRRTQDPAASREVLMSKAAAAFLKQPGRDRGGPLAFVAYHLKRLEMLPPDGTAAEQETYDWARAKACADRGVFEGKSREALTEMEQLARKHPGELVWNAALTRAFLAQSDWKRALTLAEEAVAANKHTTPGRSFEAAGITFTREAEANGGGSWLTHFTSAPNLSAYTTPILAANELFKQGVSLKTADAEMALRCWRSSIGMMHLLQTDRNVAIRMEALNWEKQLAKKLPDQAVQSVYDRPRGDVEGELQAEFTSLMALLKLHQEVFSSGDKVKIDEFKTAVETEGSFAVLDRMRRAQQE